MSYTFFARICTHWDQVKQNLLSMGNMPMGGLTCAGLRRNPIYGGKSLYLNFCNFSSNLKPPIFANRNPEFFEVVSQTHVALW